MASSPHFAIAAPWPEVALVELAPALVGAPWALVEFWAPDCLFSRLLLPTRNTLAARYSGCVPLLRCTVQGGEPQCTDWGVSALPAVVLFRHGRPARRWIGVVDVTLMTRVLDVVLREPVRSTGASA